MNNIKYFKKTDFCYFRADRYNNVFLIKAKNGIALRLYRSSLLV